MAAPNVVATSQGHNGAVNDDEVVVTLPADIAAGDLVLIFLTANNASATAPAGWTMVDSEQSVGNIWGHVLGKVAAGGETTVTVTLSTTATASYVCYRYGGPFPSLASCVESASDHDLGYPMGGADAPNLSPSWGSAECSWVWYAGSSNNNYDIEDWPSGWTGDQKEQEQGVPSGPARTHVATKDATASSQDPGLNTWEFGVNKEWVAFTIAVRTTPDRTFTLPTFGLELDASSITLEVGADVSLFLPTFELEMDVPGISLRTAGTRQVMLTGAGLETPEMTTGGDEGDVLTQHAGSPPTWESVAAGASALDDLTDVDAPAPDDNDVLSWDAATSAWVPVPAGAPDLSAAALDDIGDVDAASPGDGDVLTWDTGTSAWVAAAPAAGGDITTDPAWTAAGDQIVADGDDSAVIVPVGDEGDVWTVASGVPAWAPPSGGTGVVPGALKVYLYSTFK
jgi:hypothetical protein